MPTEGLVVVLLVALASVLIAVLMVLNRNRYRWPKGYSKINASFKGCKVTVLVPDSEKKQAGLEGFALVCAKAAYAMKQAWLWPNYVEPDKTALTETLRWTVCWLKMDDKFEEVVRSWNANFLVTYPAAHTSFIRPRRRWWSWHTCSGNSALLLSSDFVSWYSLRTRTHASSRACAARHLGSRS